MSLFLRVFVTVAVLVVAAMLALLFTPATVSTRARAGEVAVLAIGGGLPLGAAFPCVGDRMISSRSHDIHDSYPDRHR